MAYYIYAGWLEGAFYNPFSPCRNAALYIYAVNRIETDGIFSPDECRPLQQKRDWIALNREGTVAITPEPDPEGRNTLVLVIDLSCPSCQRALETLGGNPDWENYRHIALCCGVSALPTVPGWEYRRVENPLRIFDLMMTPFYYVIDPVGVVVQSYKPAI